MIFSRAVSRALLTILLASNAFILADTANAQTGGACTSDADCGSSGKCYALTYDSRPAGTNCMTQAQLSNWVTSSGTGFSHVESGAQPAVQSGGTNAGSPITSGGTNAGSQATGALKNPLKYDSLNDLLTAVLKAVIDLGSIILTLALVWVGFKFVAARGNEEAIRSARAALMWTVIGGLILLGATAIQSVITSTVSSITT